MVSTMLAYPPSYGNLDIVQGDSGSHKNTIKGLLEFSCGLYISIEIIIDGLTTWLSLFACLGSG